MDDQWSGSRSMPPSLAELRAPLLRWYRLSKRDLPWRRSRDPYAVWVAEVMLQQTRVSAVLPYYERFMKRFPDPAALAGANEEEVLAAWSGLGYYRRARAMRTAAQQVIERHDGRLPAISTHSWRYRALDGIRPAPSPVSPSISESRSWMETCGGCSPGFSQATGMNDICGMWQGDWLTGRDPVI